MKTHHSALHITGAKPLSGTFRVNSAKNSVLALMLGTLLTRERVVLQEVPRLSDILVMVELLRHLGAEVDWVKDDLHIQATEVMTCAAPYHLVSKMRASFVALGALVGRCGEARMPMPGGCAFGPRPVDRHIKAFKAIGTLITEEEGDFIVRRDSPLNGWISFEAPTVGGTQNIMLAAALGKGRVVIENAAKEPEIVDLATLLNAMGARISGAGTAMMAIEGVDTLHGVTYRPIPDRIEAGTLMLAVAATRGKVVFENVLLEHLSAVTEKLEEAGVKLEPLSDKRVLVDATGALRGVDIAAVEYPGVPTDLQAPFGSFLATAPGESLVSDHVYFEHRFTHAEPLAKMGARVEQKSNTMTIQGGFALHGTSVHAADIRAGGALIVAALAAEGETTITGVEYIDRGYERISERLRDLGATVFRESDIEVVTGTYGD